MRNLYLVRHGKVDFPDGVRRCIGKTEYPLSQKGICQAKELHTYFREQPIERVYYSPLKRCQKTAVILSGGRIPMKAEEDLAELYMGEWENIPLDELKKGLASEPENGEGRAAGLERMLRAVGRILAETKGDIVCIAHAGINCCLLSYIQGTPLETSRGLPQPYGGFSRIEIRDSGQMRVLELGRMPEEAPDVEECEAIWEHYHTPENVRLHCRQVCLEAMKIGRELNRNGGVLNLRLIQSGALLHDVARTELDHAEKGAEWVRRDGYPKVAEIVRRHHTLFIKSQEEENDADIPDETDVVYLADKLVQGETVVTLEERFEKSRKRCAGMEGDKAALAAHERRYREAKAIEKKVLKYLDNRQTKDVRDEREVAEMKLMRTEDAVGQILCHDITQIIKGVTKDAVFRKGHVIQKEDIPVLLSVGKEHIYIWENNENMLHENEAAQILYDICKNEHMHPSEVKEGKIELIADCDGLLKIDTDKLNRINALGEMMIASRHGNFPVKKQDRIAGTRVIPLVIEKEKMERAKEIGSGAPIFQIKPFQEKKVGIVTTGNEVYTGRIQDTFTPVIREKLSEYDVQIIGHEICNDHHEMITESIHSLLKKGANMVICTGGMSVDPDDRTPLGIRNTGVRIVSYGAPVLPGAMFLLAYYGGDIPIMGLPGCVMYSRRTIFDLVLPRVMAGEILKKKDLDTLGEGGLCLSCPVCTFPNCGFGK